MNAIDLFAGAGGFSTGAAMAGCHVLWAANHWPTAVQWHAANHPGTLTTRARWALINGDRMRMVTAAEGRALMGLPDGYKLPANEATAWHLLGNAVAPTQGADIINAIKAAA